VRRLRCTRIVGDNAGVTVVMEAVERKGSVNQAGCEPFPGGAVVWRYAIAFVCGKIGIVKAAEDVDSRPADSAGGEQVFNDMMAEQQHELLSVERGNRFKAAGGGPDAPAGNDIRKERAEKLKEIRSRK